MSEITKTCMRSLFHSTKTTNTPKPNAKVCKNECFIKVAVSVGTRPKLQLAHTTLCNHCCAHTKMEKPKAKFNSKAKSVRAENCSCVQNL